MAKKIVKFTFPPKLIKQPVTFRMAKRYDVMPNIRRARVTEEIGELVLELDGKQDNIEKGLKFVSKLGVKVEPIVGDIIE